MSKTYEFGNAVIIVKDKISAVAIDQKDPNNLTIYLEGASDGINLHHSSQEKRDESYNILKKDLNSDD